jgi:glutathione S-transferase
MATLYHHPLCPHSRFVRLALGEYGLEPELVEERAFERRREFLLLDPAGQTPVLVENAGLVAAGAMIIAETRRLTDWFLTKFHAEVSGWLVTEKVYKRFMSAEQGGGAPNMELVRAARANIRYHLRYIGYLVSTRNWLAGADMSYADLAAAAHLSSVDFLGDVPWDEDENAKVWYARVKSRPSFRALLGDRVMGITPPEVYADLDF